MSSELKSLYPFLLVLLLGAVNYYKRRTKKEANNEVVMMPRAEPPTIPLQPAKKKENQPLSSHPTVQKIKQQPVKQKKTRAQVLVQSVNPKKRLLLLSEILNRRH